MSSAKLVMEEFDNSSDGSYYDQQSDSAESGDSGDENPATAYRVISSAALGRLQVRYRSS